MIRIFKTNEQTTPNFKSQRSKNENKTKTSKQRKKKSKPKQKTYTTHTQPNNKLTKRKNKLNQPNKHGVCFVLANYSWTRGLP